MMTDWSGNLILCPFHYYYVEGRVYVFERLCNCKHICHILYTVALDSAPQIGRPSALIFVRFYLQLRFI